MKVQGKFPANGYEVEVVFGLAVLQHCLGVREGSVVEQRDDGELLAFFGLEIKPFTFAGRGRITAVSVRLVHVFETEIRPS